MNKASGFLAVIGITFAILVLVGMKSFKIVPAGHVGVATFLGEVQDEPYTEGSYFPVNPLYNWMEFDARQKTHMEKANVPSQDQLQTEIDVSVQFRIIGDMAPRILRDTGSFDQAIRVHLIPAVRSEIREQGKSVARAEDFFNENTLNRLQKNVETALKEYLEPKGIEIQAVLIRDISLPVFITKAIERKKEREQEVEREKAELERVRTQQQQNVVKREAQAQAAEFEAETIKKLADAEAYKIEAINKAIASNPSYLQLQAIGALTEISKDPAAKVYFLNGDSPQPLPLMHIGQPVAK